MMKISLRNPFPLEDYPVSSAETKQGISQLSRSVLIREAEMSDEPMSLAIGKFITSLSPKGRQTVLALLLYLLSQLHRAP